MKALAVAMLMTCVVEPHQDHPEIMRATVEGWLAAGLPMPRSRCLDGVEVRTSRDEADFVRWCRVGSSRAAACLTYNGMSWRIQLAPGTAIDSYGQPVIHEAMHALVRCTGIAADGYDYEHDNELVWIHAVDQAEYLYRIRLDD